MRVALDTSLFSDATVDPASLLQLILACRRPSPHFTVLTSAWSRPIETWLEQWPAQIRRTLEEVLRDAVESARRGFALTVVVRPGESRWREDPSRGPRVSVADALALARSPLHVLVENRRNDGRFLARFAVTLPDTQRRLFEEALARGWIVFEQGGGLSEVKCLLDDLDAQPADPVLCPQGPQRDVRRWRLVVVVDRDCLEVKRPGSIAKEKWKAPPRDASQPSKVSTELIERARATLPEWEGRPGAYQLHRRAIENYIPLRSLRAWVDRGSTVNVKRARRAKVDALAQLDVLTENGVRPRWHFGMKEGLGGDRPTGLSTPATADEHVHALFHVLSLAERLALQDGFTTRSESIADLLFDRGIVLDDWLRVELTLGGSTEASDLLHNLLNRM